MSLTRQFAIVAAVVTFTAMAVLAAWVGSHIQSGMLRSSAFASALLMESFLAPHVQEVPRTGEIDAAQRDELDRLFTETLEEAGMWSVKIWSVNGEILYISGGAVLVPEAVGPGRIARAAAGEIVVNFEEAGQGDHAALSHSFIEIYAPLYPPGSSEIVAIGEFHADATSFQQEVFTAYVSSWVIVGITAVAMIVALYFVVLGGSQTITRQQRAMEKAKQESDDFARQNEELRIASDRTRIQAGELNEQLLGRVGADLHDGPIQVLSVLNFKLSHVLSTRTREQKRRWEDPANIARTLRESVDGLVALNSEALDELRSISAGLVLPELGALSLDEVLRLAVARHEALTGTSVAYRAEGLPLHASHVVKTCLYRVVQEALNNSARYAGGKDQAVTAIGNADAVSVEVSDTGPGIDSKRLESDDRKGLGLLGMTNRVGALGGTLEITSPPGAGTAIRASIPLAGAEAARWP